MTELNQRPAFWRGLNRVTEFFGTVGGGMLFIIAFINVYEILRRWIFSSPSDWVFDLSIYLLVWYGCITIAYAQQTKAHICVDIITSKMKDETRTILYFAGRILVLFYAGISLFYGIQMVMNTYAKHQRTTNALNLPVWILQVAVPIGMLLFGLQVLQDLWNDGVSIKQFFSTHSIHFKNLLPTVIVIVCAVACAFVMYYVSLVSGIVLLLFTLLLGGVPVFTALGLVGSLAFCMVYQGFDYMFQVPYITYKSLNDFAMVALPMFILAGKLFEVGGMGEELFDFCNKMVGHFTGGLAVATVLACAIFAAITGTSAACAATIGVIAIPAMVRHGYSKRMALGVVAAGGTLGILIPPSNPMIIYSSLTNESTGALFMAGLIPGILLAVMFAVYCMIAAARGGQEKLPPATGAERMQSAKKGVFGLLAPVIIIVGVYTGIFTTTEAAAVTVVYAFLVNILRGRTKLKDLSHISAESTKSSSMILSIMSGALVLGTIFTQLKLPQNLTSWVLNAGVPGWLVIVIIMLLLMVMGTMLETVSILYITIPIFYPLIKSLGFDGIWFAVLVVVNMELAFITPPVGLNLFVVKGLDEESSMAEIIRSVLPFIIIMAVFLIIVALVPSMSTWLPGTMGYGR